MKKVRILKKLKALLTENLHINPAKNPIHIRLEEDNIVMEGIVERVAYKKKALLCAMGLEGVKGVIDRLRVKPAKKMGDKEIKNHIIDAITEEPALDASTIDVQVRDGVVDLEGKVPSLSHKRLCGVFAWWVPGSTDVINSLIVDPPEEDSPEELEDAIRIVLEKDRLVDASKIGVAVDENWVVTLTGTVNSDAESLAAEDDAWYVWGVNDVINKIEVVK